jgi:hypothetical protein
MRLVTMRLAFGVLLGVLQAACTVGLVPRVDYKLRPMAVVPLGSIVTDSSKAFAEIFCAVLPHTDNGKWGRCGPYLETEVGPQAPVETSITTPLKVMLVGGAFSECFEDKGLYVFQPSLEHLRRHGIVFGPRVKIGGTATPIANARKIAQYLRENSGDYIAIGHSKGAVDLMAAIQYHDIARERIKVLVSVAGAIAGTRLSDLGVPAGIIGFRDAVRRAGLGNCKIEDHGGIGSLQRGKRYKELRAWKPPATLRSYSIVGVSSYDKTSKPLNILWKTNALYSLDQDSHIIAEEGIIPGGEFLGVASADHWAMALPMSEHHLTKDKVDQNAFPRTALLEAILRHVLRPAGAP